MDAGGVAFGSRSPIRKSLSFRVVNRRGSPQYDPGLHRHHLLPRQVGTLRCFTRMTVRLGKERLALDDFRQNGILLPAHEEAVWRTSLPLHRGPHRLYNEMVIARFGEIEAMWSMAKRRNAQSADTDALEALADLRRTLLLQLLDRRRPLQLNRQDPLGAVVDFAAIDDMAEELWRATG